jgi:hypothetical protein
MKTSEKFAFTFGFTEKGISKRFAPDLPPPAEKYGGFLFPKITFDTKASPCDIELVDSQPKG